MCADNLDANSDSSDELTDTEDMDTEAEETLDSLECSDTVSEGLTSSASAGRAICLLENILLLAKGKCRETGCNRIYHVSYKC